MLKKFTSVRFILTIGLLLSVAFAAYSIYYKVRYWGFDFAPKKSTAVWTIEAQISFMPNGEPIKVSLATPKVSKEYKILDEDTVADGYKVSKDTKENRIVLTSGPREDKQQLYYRILLFDNEDGRGKIPAPFRPIRKSRFLTNSGWQLPKNCWNFRPNSRAMFRSRLSACLIKIRRTQRFWPFCR